MKKLRRKVYLLAGYNTVSLGTGRKEFKPKKPRPGIEKYIKEAGQAALEKIGGAGNVDEGVIGNFMAARFNKQANLPAFLPMIDEGLLWKPGISVEGACASGGLALMAGIKSVLAETADVVLSIGVEVQNTVKAIYGADRGRHGPDGRRSWRAGTTWFNHDRLRSVLRSVAWHQGISNSGGSERFRSR